jgi:hypothetical protein
MTGVGVAPRGTPKRCMKRAASGSAARRQGGGALVRAIV